MSSRPPGQDRFSQMSEQAAIIARKKAEIEAKLKAAADGKNQVKTVPETVQSSKATPPGKLSKNRWGFKGKRPNVPEVSKAQEDSSEASGSQNQFSNDGSFIEQFKKQQQQKQNQFSNDGSFLEQFKKMKEQPKAEAKPEEAMPSVSQQNDWYKAALARAKQIAHTMSSPMETKKDPEIIKEEPKLEPKGKKNFEVIFQRLVIFKCSILFQILNMVVVQSKLKTMHIHPPNPLQQHL